MFGSHCSCCLGFCWQSLIIVNYCSACVYNTELLKYMTFFWVLGFYLQVNSHTSRLERADFGFAFLHLTDIMMEEEKSPCGGIPNCHSSTTLYGLRHIRPEEATMAANVSSGIWTRLICSATAFLFLVAAPRISSLRAHFRG